MYLKKCKLFIIFPKNAVQMYLSIYYVYNKILHLKYINLEKYRK